jgi:predicted kinase
MKKFKKFISEGVNDPAIFKAVFLAGGPGSGKSFIIGRTALASLGFKVINSDVAFEAALSKAGLEANPENIYSTVGQELRGRAKILTKKKMDLALQGRLGLVIDGTGKDYDKIQKQANKLREIGYEVAMIFVNTDLDTALERNKMRSRSLPDSVVEEMWKDVQKNLGKFQNFFRQKMFIVDNSSGSNYEGAVQNTYKRIMQWSKTAPDTSSAKKWIDSQRKLREDLQEKIEIPKAGNLGIKRKEMPQVEGKNVSKFLDFLKRNGVKFKEKMVDSKKLKPTQNQFNQQKIQGMIDDIDTKKQHPIMISSDGFVIDGHHRWLAHYNLNRKISVVEID